MLRRGGFRLLLRGGRSSEPKICGPPVIFLPYPPALNYKKNNVAKLITYIFFSDFTSNKISKVRYSTPTDTNIKPLIYIIY